MNPTNKVPSGTRVQTRVTFADIADGLGYDLSTHAGGTYIADDTRSAWAVYKAALDSVILPEGKRFEVGDKVQFQYSSEGKWVDGRIFAYDGKMHQEYPQCVRPLPQTVELMMEEKRIRLMNAICDRKKTSQVNALGIIIDALSGSQDTGKTLDQLCKEYNVPTTREVP